MVFDYRDNDGGDDHDESSHHHHFHQTDMNDVSSESDRSAFFPYHPAAQSSVSKETHEIPLIDEMLEGMALSMLIFLMADLRLLSATGRISLKWECLVLDNDLMPRTKAMEVAGLIPNVAEHSLQEFQRDQHRNVHEGLSPAQLMAMVLVETKKTIDAKKQKEDERKEQIIQQKQRQESDATESSSMTNAARQTTTNHSNGNKHHRTSSSSSSLEESTWPHLKPQQQDIFSPMADIAATGRKEEINPLLKAYVHMVAQDMNRSIPSVEARRSTLSLLLDPNELKERDDEGDDNDDNDSDKDENNVGHANAGESSGVDQPATTEATPISPPRNTETKSDEKIKSARKLFTTRKSSMDHSHNSRDSNPLGGDDDQHHHTNSQRPNILNAAAAAAQQVQENVDRQLHIIQERRKSIMMTQKQRDQLRVEETTDALFGMGQQQRRVRASVMGTLDSERRRDGMGRNLSSDELLMIMERAVESRIHGKLSFMSSFFRRGTICRLMCKSNARVVWINDWYPLKDLTYAIAVDQEKKRLLVLFRGAITKQDWSKAMEAEQKRVKNPISEDFDGRPEKIGIFSGFYQYLFRVRKDTGTTKYDEIVNLAHQYGINRIDDRFTRNGPIKVISFGSPMIGCNDFADCFRYQEERGKIMYARFYNSNDLVAYLPTNFTVTKRGSHYRHVGIGVRIPRVPRPISMPFGNVIRRRWRPSVYYVGREGFWASYCRGISRNALLNAPWFWQTKEMHTMMEMLKRVMEGSERHGKGGDFDLLKQPMEALYRDLAGFAPSMTTKDQQ